MQGLFILIFLAIVITIGVIAWRQEQQRRQALLLWAHGRGWRLDSSGRKDWHKNWPGLKVFDRGHSKSSKNIVKGAIEGLDVSCFDFQYVTGSGKNRQTHRRGVVILGCEFPTIPLQIRREHAFDKVGEFLGKDDIDFESAEFSRRFYVTSSDRKWAYDIIHGRTMEYLLGAPDFGIEFGFQEIAVYRTGFNQPPQHEQALDLALTLYRLIPDYVIQQMKGR
ncbi:MAG: hypothetical protein ABIK96_10010 [bacterium]